MLLHCFMPDRKPFANSFLPLCSANVPCRTGNFSPIVSCRHAPPLSRAGWETIRKQFPAAMLLHCFMLDEKLSSNSFLPPCSATAPRRMGNYSQTVSCHYAPLLPHAGWETIREQFPVTMFHHCPMPNRKLSANSFLSLCSTTAPTPDEKLSANSFLPPCSTTAPCRMGNYPQTVSFRYESHCSQVGQETFRKQFPSAMLRQCPTPDGKLSANSFLPLCSTTAPCRTRNYPPTVSCRHAPPMVPSRTGNYPPIVSCRHAPPPPHAGWETIEKRL